METGGGSGRDLGGTAGGGRVKTLPYGKAALDLIGAKYI
jgi:hypothetical protein